MPGQNACHNGGHIDGQSVTRHPPGHTTSVGMTPGMTAGMAADMTADMTAGMTAGTPAGTPLGVQSAVLAGMQTSWQAEKVWTVMAEAGLR